MEASVSTTNAICFQAVKRERRRRRRRLLVRVRRSRAAKTNLASGRERTNAIGRRRRPSRTTSTGGPKRRRLTRRRRRDRDRIGTAITAVTSDSPPTIPRGPPTTANIAITGSATRSVIIGPLPIIITDPPHPTTGNGIATSSTCVLSRVFTHLFTLKRET